MSGFVVDVCKTPLYINIFSMIILTIFLTDSYQKNHSTKSQRYVDFQYMVIFNLLLLLADTGCWLTIKRADPSMRTLQIIFTTIYYVLDPIPSYFFIRFTDVVLDVPIEKQNRLKLWYGIPVVLHMVIALISPFTGWFFRITEANEYQRGVLLPISFILSFALMFLANIKVILRYTKARKRNNKVAKILNQYGYMLKFTLIPIIGGVVQIFFNDVTYVWNITVIALLVLYINNQNTEITTDTLTGIYNRREAFAYFDRFVRERGRVKCDTAVVVLDIDQFKCINDRYGHIIGDEAIIAVARALETEFDWDDFICRFGGDEFMVITKHGEQEKLDAAIARVNAHLKKLFDTGALPFVLSVSAGYAVLCGKDQTLDSLFQQADAMMFTRKARLMRRASDR